MGELHVRLQRKHTKIFPARGRSSPPLLGRFQALQLAEISMHLTLGGMTTPSDLTQFLFINFKRCNPTPWLFMYYHCDRWTSSQKAGNFLYMCAHWDRHNFMSP